MRGWTAVMTPNQATLPSSIRSSPSGSHGCLINASTMRSPSVETKISLRDRFRWEQRCISRACRVRSVAIVIVLEIAKLRLQIRRAPKQDLVQVFAPDGTDQSLYERMRKRNVGNRFDFRNAEHSKIGLPLVVSVERVVIRVEVPRKAVPTDRAPEHPAQRHSVHNASVRAEPNDAPRKLVHYQQNPMSSQGCGFAAEQVAAPQAIFHVTEKRKPGRTVSIRPRPVMHAQDTANNPTWDSGVSFPPRPRLVLLPAPSVRDAVVAPAKTASDIFVSLARHEDSIAWKVLLRRRNGTAVPGG
jgi:hypothetical protein